MKNSDFPCWLSPKDKAIAEALISQAGFIYCGREEGVGIYDFEIPKCCGWRLASAYGEVAIEVVKDGAVFGKCLEVLPNVDFEKEVKLAKQVIREATKKW